MQRLSEDAVKYESDLKHTSIAKVQAEDKEKKARGCTAGGQRQAAGCQGRATRGSGRAAHQSHDTKLGRPRGF